MRAFGVFLLTLGLCTAFACGMDILCYMMEGAIIETGLCIFGTAVGAAVTSIGIDI